MAGDLRSALDATNEAMSIAAELDRPYDYAFAGHHFGLVKLASGDLVGARSALEAAEALSRQNDYRFLTPYTTGNLGLLRLRQGDKPNARRLLEEAVSVGYETGNLHPAMRAEIRLGWACLADRQWQVVEDIATRLCRRTRELEYRAVEAWALRLLACCQSCRGDGHAAAANLATAAAIAEECGLRPDVAHCHYANAIVHGMLDRPDQAWEHFARSRALYLALGMVPPENVSLTVPNAYLDVPGLLTG